MKNVAKIVVLGVALMPMVLLTGCNKKCGEHQENHKLEKMKKEYGGK